MNVIVFDFDDTLFPTSHYYLYKDKSYPQIAKSILNLISLAKKFCDKLYIITNAEKDWVRMCTTEFLPGCEKLCDDVDIISTWNYFPGDFSEWKLRAFKPILSPVLEGKNCQLISIGDSVHDREAAITMKSENVTVKNIKLMNIPDLDQLLKQQIIICKILRHVFNYKNHLDLMFFGSKYDSSISIIQKSSDLDKSSIAL